MQSAFAGQGIPLRYRRNLPNSVALLDRDRNVAVSVYESASGAHAVTAPPFQAGGPPPFHREEKANLVVFFKPSLTESIKGAFARIH